MSDGSRKKVEGLLGGYHGHRQALAVLAYRIQKCAAPDYEGMVETLVFAHSGRERVQSSIDTGKVERIAETYRLIAERERRDEADSLLEEYIPLDEEMKFLDYCIRSLPKVPRELLVGMYVDNVGWDELCARFSCCRSALAKKRNRAITTVANMFDKWKS